MNSHRLDDDLNSFVSWIDDGGTTASSVAPSRRGAAKQKVEQPLQKDYYRLGAQARQKQEQNLDAYKKEIFDLRLSIYHYREKLNSLSTENVDKLTKENNNLKKDNELYASELKRYKKLVLDLDDAVTALQKKKTCDHLHGMSEQERHQFEEYKSDAEYYREQNEALLEQIEQLRQESKQLRSSRGPSDQNDDSSEDYKELKKKFKRAKLKIEELQKINQQQQQEMDKSRLQEEIKQKDDTRLRSILSTRDRALEKVEEKHKRILELEGEVERLQESLDETEHDLADKAEECEKYLKELEDLHLQNTEMAAELERFDQLQRDYEEQAVALADREKEIDTLSEEMSNLVAYIEKIKDGQDEATGEEIAALEEALQQKEEEVRMLEERFKDLNDAHQEDLSNYEEQLLVLKDELLEKDQKYKELEAQFRKARSTLQNQQKSFEEALESQYNELIMAVKEKEVSIAALESDIEVQQDIAEREKKLLKEKLENSYAKLAEQEKQRTDDRGQKGHEVVAKLESELAKYKKRLEEQSDDCNRLKQKLYKANQKNALLNDMLDESKRSSQRLNEKPDKSETLLKLNTELRKELQDKDSILALQKKKYEDIKQRHIDLQKQFELMRKQLSKRDAMLANSLIATDNMKRHQGIMEGILYEQATGSTAKIRAKSAMSS